MIHRISDIDRKNDKIRLNTKLKLERAIYGFNDFNNLTCDKREELKKEALNLRERFIKNEVISKPSDAVIDCKKNTYKEIFSEIPGVDKNTYMKNIKVYTVDDKIEKVENSSKTVNASTQLRDDIQSGRIIKIPTGHGFIWRRVK